MGSTTGYSGSPLIKKLGLKPTHRAVLIAPPDGFPALLGREVEVVSDVRGLAPGPFDYLHLFAFARATVASGLPVLRRSALDDDGMLWISWWKKASRRDVVGLEAGGAAGTPPPRNDRR